MPSRFGLYSRAAIGLYLMLLPLCMQAEQWTVLTRVDDLTIELDQQSITYSTPGSRLAWTRIALDDESARTAGYASIHILGRYDCGSPGFRVLRRSYRDGTGHPLREENPAKPRQTAVKPGTINERIYRAVCQPASFAELRRLAEAAGENVDRVLSRASGSGSAKTADDRTERVEERIFPPPDRRRKPASPG
jgi:carbonic anhydrase